MIIMMSPSPLPPSLSLSPFLSNPPDPIVLGLLGVGSLDLHQPHPLPDPTPQQPRHAPGPRHIHNRSPCHIHQLQCRSTERSRTQHSGKVHHLGGTPRHHQRQIPHVEGGRKEEHFTSFRLVGRFKAFPLHSGVAGRFLLDRSSSISQHSTVLLCRVLVLVADSSLREGRLEMPGEVWPVLEALLQQSAL